MWHHGPAMAHKFGRCDFCGAQAPVHQASYRQNTGMLIMRQTRHFEGRACRQCSHDLFVRTTLHTLVLGWWGMISMVLTPFFIVNNLVCWGYSRALPRENTVRRNLLEERREYALNLLDGKDEATVVDVLARDTGLQKSEVASWVQSLRRPAA